jgi:hypothetical protein
VRDGDPGWPAYGADRAVGVFGDPGSGAPGPVVVRDPRGALREAWDGVR